MYVSLPPGRFKTSQGEVTKGRALMMSHWQCQAPCRTLAHLCHSRPHTFFPQQHPNISMHILHTVLYTFPRVLTRRTCLTIKSFFSW